MDRAHVAMVVVALLSMACKREAQEPSQGGATASQTGEPAQPAQPGAGPAGALGGATLTGTVRFRGKLPPAAAPNKSFPECARGAAKLPADPSLVAGGDGGLADAFVWIKEGLPAGSYPTPNTPVAVDQKHCEFAPRVVGAQVGQPVAFVNSDAFLHNVKAASFNVAMPMAGMRITKKFDAPQIMADLTCEVHAWMRAYVGVVPHPFYAVTDEKGAFRIAQLPAGKLTVEVWHERLGLTTKPVEVAENGTTELEIELKGP